jgi:hypothetical protein
MFHFMPWLPWNQILHNWLPHLQLGCTLRSILTEPNFGYFRRHRFQQSFVACIYELLAYKSTPICLLGVFYRKPANLCTNNIVYESESFFNYKTPNIRLIWNTTSSFSRIRLSGRPRWSAPLSNRIKVVGLTKMASKQSPNRTPAPPIQWILNR